MSTPAMAARALAALDNALSDVSAERHRQDFLRDTGRFPRTLADAGISPGDRLAVVAEEFGEVAEVVADAIARPDIPLATAHLREELVQLAACAVAWVEYLDTVVPVPASPAVYADPPESDGLAPAVAPAPAGVAA